MKKLFYILIAFLLSLNFSCKYLNKKESFIIEASRVKQIKFFQMDGKIVVNEILVDNEKEILEIVCDINDNYSFLNKFKSTYRAKFFFNDRNDSLLLTFNERYLRAIPGGTFKMKKSIDEIISGLKK